MPIKEEEEEEPKKDTGEPGHKCVPNLCRAFYAFRTLSLHVVSPAPSTRVQGVLHVPPAVPVYVPSDCCMSCAFCKAVDDGDARDAYMDASDVDMLTQFSEAEGEGEGQGWAAPR